jgi:integrase
VIQQLAGHADIKATMQYYATVREDDLELARDAASEH